MSIIVNVFNDVYTFESRYLSTNFMGNPDNGYTYNLYISIKLGVLFSLSRLLLKLLYGNEII